MEIPGLLFALVLLIVSGLALVFNLLSLSFTWGGLVLHLVIAGLVYGVLQTIGSRVDTRFRQAAHELAQGKQAAAAADRGLLRTFGLLIMTLLSFLLYLLALALYASATLGLSTYLLLLRLERVPLVLPIGVFIIAFGTVAATLFGLYRVLFLPRPRPDGVPLAPPRHRRLWRLSSDIAHTLGTRPVDHIMATLEPGIEVYQEGGLGRALFGGPRVLRIGLPSLHDLRIGEFSAILACEYGHFSQWATRWSALADYMSTALPATLRSMPGSSRAEHDDSSPVDSAMWVNPGYWILHVYARLFFRTTSGFARLREVMADMKAIQLYGGPTFGDALLKVGLNDRLFAEALDRHYLPDLVRGGQAISDPGALLQAVHATATPATLTKMKADLLDLGGPDVFTSHPPMRMRLEYAAQVCGSAAAASGATDEPVMMLFDDWENVNAHVMGRFNRRLLAAVKAEDEAE